MSDSELRELMRRVERLVWKMTNALPAYIDQEEAVLVAYEELVLAIKKYDVKNAVGPLDSYVIGTVYFRMLDWLRRQSATYYSRTLGKREGAKIPLSLSLPVGDEDTPELGDMIACRGDFEADAVKWILFKEVFADLDERSAWVAMMSACGWKLDEIADHLGVTPARVSQICMRVGRSLTKSAA